MPTWLLLMAALSSVVNAAILRLAASDTTPEAWVVSAAPHAFVSGWDLRGWRTNTSNCATFETLRDADTPVPVNALQLGACAVCIACDTSALDVSLAGANAITTRLRAGGSTAILFQRASPVFDGRVSFQALAQVDVASLNPGGNVVLGTSAGLAIVDSLSDIPVYLHELRVGMRGSGPAAGCTTRLSLDAPLVNPDDSCDIAAPGTVWLRLDYDRLTRSFTFVYAGSRAAVLLARPSVTVNAAHFTSLSFLDGSRPLREWRVGLVARSQLSDYAFNQTTLSYSGTTARLRFNAFELRVAEPVDEAPELSVAAKGNASSVRVPTPPFLPYDISAVGRLADSSLLPSGHADLDTEVLPPDQFPWGVHRFDFSAERTGSLRFIPSSSSPDGVFGLQVSSANAPIVTPLALGALSAWQATGTSYLDVSTPATSVLAGAQQGFTVFAVLSSAMADGRFVLVQSTPRVLLSWGDPLSSTGGLDVSLMPASGTWRGRVRAVGGHMVSANVSLTSSAVTPHASLLQVTVTAGQSLADVTVVDGSATLAMGGNFSIPSLLRLGSGQSASVQQIGFSGAVFEIALAARSLDAAETANLRAYFIHKYSLTCDAEAPGAFWDVNASYPVTSAGSVSEGSPRCVNVSAAVVYGALRRTCNAGSWSGAAPVCDALCPLLPRPVNTLGCSVLQHRQVTWTSESTTLPPGWAVWPPLPSLDQREMLRSHGASVTVDTRERQGRGAPRDGALAVYLDSPAWSPPATLSHSRVLATMQIDSGSAGVAMRLSSVLSSMYTITIAPASLPSETGRVTITRVVSGQRMAVATQSLAGVFASIMTGRPFGLIITAASGSIRVYLRRSPPETGLSDSDLLALDVASHPAWALAARYEDPLPLPEAGTTVGLYVDGLAHVTDFVTVQGCDDGVINGHTGTCLTATCVPGYYPVGAGGTDDGLRLVCRGGIWASEGNGSHSFDLSADPFGCMAHAPSWPAPTLRFDVDSDAAPASVIGSAAAAASPDASLRYTVASGYELGLFAVHSCSGEIRVARSLRGHAGNYSLFIVASIEGNGPLVSSNVSVIVTIRAAELPPSPRLPPSCLHVAPVIIPLAAELQPSSNVSSFTLIDIVDLTRVCASAAGGLVAFALAQCDGGATGLMLIRGEHFLAYSPSCLPPAADFAGGIFATTCVMNATEATSATGQVGGTSLSATVTISAVFVISFQPPLSGNGTGDPEQLVVQPAARPRIDYVGTLPAVTGGNCSEGTHTVDRSHFSMAPWASDPVLALDRAGGSLVRIEGIDLPECVCITMGAYTRLLCNSTSKLTFVAPPVEGESPALSLLTQGCDELLSPPLRLRVRPPTITYVSSAEGISRATGGVVTITGSGFGPPLRSGHCSSDWLRESDSFYLDAPVVMLTDRTCDGKVVVPCGSLVHTSDSQVSCTVPSGADLSSLAVTAGNSTARCDGCVTFMTPVVTSVSRNGHRFIAMNGSLVVANVTAGDLVTLHGSGFGKQPCSPLACVFLSWAVTAEPRAANLSLLSVSQIWPYASQLLTPTAPVCDGSASYVGEGELPSAAIVEINDSVFSFRVPPGIGTRSVRLSIGGDLAIGPAITLLYRAPRVLSVGPSHGTADGGALVTLLFDADLGSRSSWGQAALATTSPAAGGSLPHRRLERLSLLSAQPAFLRLSLRGFCFISEHGAALLLWAGSPPSLCATNASIDGDRVAFVAPPGVGRGHRVTVDIFDPFTGSTAAGLNAGSIDTGVVWDYDPPVVTAVAPTLLRALGGASEAAGTSTGTTLLAITGHNFGPLSEISAALVSINGVLCSNIARVLQDGIVALQCSLSLTSSSSLAVGAANLAVVVGGQNGTITRGIASSLTLACRSGFAGSLDQLCEPCPAPDVAVCPTGDTPFSAPQPMPGYAYAANQSGTCPANTRYCILPCEPASACTGSGCSDGYSGDRCSACATGFYKRTGGFCARCPDNGIALLVGCALASICTLLIAYSLRLRGASLELGRLAIIADYFQGLAVLGSTRAPWPPAVRELLHTLSAFSFNLDVLAPECFALGVTYQRKFVFVLALPVAALGLLAALALGGLAFKRCVLGRRQRLNRHLAALASVSLSVLVFGYLPLLRVTLDALNCVPALPPDLHRYLQSVGTTASGDCEAPTGVYRTLLPLSITSCALYVLGIPAFIALLMTGSRERVTLDQHLRAVGIGDDRLSNPQAYSTRKALGRLYGAYRPPIAWVWPIIQLLRKAALGVAAVLFSGSSAFQLAACCLVGVIGLVLQASYAPFMENGEAPQRPASGKPVGKQAPSSLGARVAASVAEARERMRKSSRRVLAAGNTRTGDGDMKRGRSQSGGRGFLARLLRSNNSLEVLLTASLTCVALLGVMLSSPGPSAREPSAAAGADSIGLTAVALIATSIGYAVVLLLCDMISASGLRCVGCRCANRRREAGADRPAQPPLSRKAQLSADATQGMVDTSFNPIHLTRKKDGTSSSIDSDPGNPASAAMRSLLAAGARDGPPPAQVWQELVVSHVQLLAHYDELRARLVAQSRDNCNPGNDAAEQSKARTVAGLKQRYSGSAQRAGTLRKRVLAVRRQQVFAAEAMRPRAVVDDRPLVSLSSSTTESGIAATATEFTAQISQEGKARRREVAREGRPSNFEPRGVTLRHGDTRRPVDAEPEPMSTPPGAAAPRRNTPAGCGTGSADAGPDAACTCSACATAPTQPPLHHLMSPLERGQLCNGS